MTRHVSHTHGSGSDIASVWAAGRREGGGRGGGCSRTALQSGPRVLGRNSVETTAVEAAWQRVNNPCISIRGSRACRWGAVRGAAPRGPAARRETREDTRFSLGIGMQRVLRLGDGGMRRRGRGTHSAILFLGGELKRVEAVLNSCPHGCSSYLALYAKGRGRQMGARGGQKFDASKKTRAGRSTLPRERQQ